MARDTVSHVRGSAQKLAVLLLLLPYVSRCKLLSACGSAVDANQSIVKVVAEIEAEGLAEHVWNRASVATGATMHRNPYRGLRRTAAAAKRRELRQKQQQRQIQEDRDDKTNNANG